MQDRRNTQSIFWGGLMIIFGILGALEVYIDLNVWIWIVALVVCGLGAYGLYASNRTDKALLLESYILLVIAGLIGFVELDVLVDSFIATYVLASIAIPFLYVYLRDRSQWWAQIPMYVLFAIALMVPLIEYDVLEDGYIATYVLAAIALPFVVVFLRDRSQWWALIPPYALIVIGLMVGLITDGILDGILIAAYIMFAIALPFFIVYGRDRAQLWALIVAGVNGLIGLAFAMAGAATQYVIPVILIVAGGWILLRQLVKK